MTDPTKRCHRCKEVKPLDAFSRDHLRRDGRQGRCKDCDRIVGKQWRERNPEYFARKSKERYHAVGKFENADRYERNRDSYLARRDASLRSVRGRLYHLFSAARGRCYKSGQEFSLSLDFLLDLFEQQGGRCALTGIEFTLDRNPEGERFHLPFNPSIDRKDCSLGYVPDNVRIVCVMVNLALNRFGDDAFDRMCRAYVECHQ